MSVDINQIIDMRVNHPEQIGFVMRDRGMGIRPNAKFLMIAADDPARGNLAAEVTLGHWKTAGICSTVCARPSPLKGSRDAWVQLILSKT